MNGKDENCGVCPHTAFETTESGAKRCLECGEIDPGTCEHVVLDVQGYCQDCAAPIDLDHSALDEPDNADMLKEFD